MASQGQVIRMPGATQAPRSIRSKMDTLELTIRSVDSWKLPPFQRQLRMSARVMEVVEELKVNGGVLPGILTLGKLSGDTYLIDGQHRVAAFRESGLPEAYVDVRICEFESMEEMASEFMKLNSQLVRMKTDDILKAMESFSPHIQQLRRKCPFIGYSHIRSFNPAIGRAQYLISMATAVRTWFGSHGDPTPGPPSEAAAKMMNDESTPQMVDFYSACFEAWGYDKSNWRLWGALNVGILAWLWRRVVLGDVARSANARGGRAPMRLTRQQFVTCMMGLSADALYVEWLVGRSLSAERDRAPCWMRVRTLFSKRLADAGERATGWPGGDWQTG